MSSSADRTDALKQVELAVEQGKLTASALPNVRRWLLEDGYSDYLPELLQHIQEQQWQALDDAFWTVIPFGTGGRRGRMYPIGSNAINDRTIGESAQGLAEYVQASVEGPWSCAIAYDTRINSRRFAELCAAIMVAHGFQVHFLDGYRSTPELSFLVRHRQCSCGIMVTASHNPPSDNAVKVYWSSGVQVRPPHDAAIIERVMTVEKLIETVPFDQSVTAGNVQLCGKEIDEAYLSAVLQCRSPGPRDLSVLYSPLHGVGTASVVPVLQRDGFEKVEVFGPHAEPDGNFPNVPDHVSNPENPAVFDAMIAHAQTSGAELILATDPDCDRMGCAAPRTSDTAGPWSTFTGNQLCALLCDYVLEQRKQGGGLRPEQYVVTTLVTTRMVRRIAESYGVRTFDNLLVGFKWICGVIDEEGPAEFLYGTEESHGFLVGTHARDKDGAVACMLLAELAAQLKQAGQTLHDKLESLFWQHGYHQERLLNVRMEGSEGMANMERLMKGLRTAPPTTLGGMPVAAVLDYQQQTRTTPDGKSAPLDGPKGNLVITEFAEPGNYVAIRPSGTEPKVKGYMFSFTPPELLADLELSREEMTARLDRLEADFRKLAEAAQS